MEYPLESNKIIIKIKYKSEQVSNNCNSKKTISIWRLNIIDVKSSAIKWEDEECRSRGTEDAAINLYNLCKQVAITFRRGASINWSSSYSAIGPGLF